MVVAEVVEALSEADATYFLQELNAFLVDPDDIPAYSYGLELINIWQQAGFPTEIIWPTRPE